MKAPKERRVAAGRFDCRVWEQGEGAPLLFLGGLRGLPRWTPFLDRLAERRRVIAPSVPGLPGALGHDGLDTLPDWLAVVLDLLDACGFHTGDLVGASLGATLAAEVAIFSPEKVRRLVLAAPFGLFDPADPVTDPWAQLPGELPALVSSEPERLAAALAAPEGTDATEWGLMLHRANEASARLLWPFGDLGISRRLHRIRQPTLIVWGSRDRLIPPSYAKRFAAGVSGPVEVREIEGAGHVLEIDRPDEVAGAVLGFLS